MKTVMKYLSLFVFVLFISACQHAHNHSRAARIVIEHQSGPGSHLPISAQALKNDPHAFQIAIVTDRTGGHRAGVFPDAVRKLNLLQPEFVMSVGDLIEGYTKDTSVIHNEWDEFDSFVKKLNMPFLYLPGNHDMTNDVMAKIWQERLGPAYYHFVYKDVLFTCLNSMDPNIAISEEQISWLEKTIAETKDCRWNLVFVHHPMWNNYGEPTWKRVEKILQTGPDYTVFAGHNHRYIKRVRDDHKHFTLATTGGGSALRGHTFGEFDHVLWLTMNENGPLIANLLLEGIWDENIMTEDKKAFYTMVNNPNNVKVPLLLFKDVLDDEIFTMRVSNNFDRPITMNMKLNKQLPFTLEKSFPEQIAL